MLLINHMQLRYNVLISDRFKNTTFVIRKYNHKSVARIVNSFLFEIIYEY